MTLFLSQHFVFMLLKGGPRVFRAQSKGARQVAEEKARLRERKRTKITGPQMLSLCRLFFSDGFSNYRNGNLLSQKQKNKPTNKRYRAKCNNLHYSPLGVSFVSGFVLLFLVWVFLFSLPSPVASLSRCRRCLNITQEGRM